MTNDETNDARTALYDLLAGGRGLRTGRAGGQACPQDDELADFLCKAQEVIVSEARRLLAQRAAE